MRNAGLRRHRSLGGIRQVKVGIDEQQSSLYPIHSTMPTTVTPPSAPAVGKEVKHEANTVLENSEEVLDELVNENGEQGR